MARPAVSWILLTMGDRPTEVAAAVSSIPDRPGGPDADVVERTEVIVVANGVPEGLPVVPSEVADGVRVVHSPENLGIPGGRNLGAATATADVLAFLDDDATIAAPEAVRAALARFAAEPDLGVVALRIVDPESGHTMRRHVPRLRSGDADRSGPVTSFLGGACIIRRSSFVEVGGYEAALFYALEETDLAWRLVDAGWRIDYVAEAVVHHPATDISRHGAAHERTARNRVMVARRLLPMPLAPVYVLTWSAITLLRGRSVAAWRDWWRGTRAGLAAPVERRPIGWAGVWRLTRLGRPPII
ncbi:MAG: glycosyltransferase family 2 protein [Acidimicrobiales bacterium]